MNIQKLLNIRNKNKKFIIKEKMIFLFLILCINMFSKEDALTKLINDYYNSKKIDLYDINISDNHTEYKLGNVEYVNKKMNLKLKNKELLEIAEKIYRNETGGKRENLVTWNSGENFPSLGIGHFIWSKSNGSNGIFGETVPALIDFYRQKGVKLPRILEENRYSPWKSRDELLSRKVEGDMDIEELIEFFENTKEIQVLYILNRLENAYDNMIRTSENSEKIKEQFNRVLKSHNGIYALLDYINFKGEGIKTISSYNNQGWGLKQVLENMNGVNLGEEALVEFSDSAKNVLTNRVLNAPKNEYQWLIGWHKRVETYKK